ncbi:MAG: BatA domain-containing protein [Gemmatimonadaceae bacterium]|nr:BatA domain-containing protein [Gemmatimonadaceae bacterium]
MPILAAPLFLLGAALAAGVVVALHLLAWRRPAPRLLPTARFAPAASTRALSRTVQLRDVVLLFLRVAALLLAGLALARPSWHPARRGVARVLVLDAARRVASAREVTDSARTAAAGAATVVRVRVDSTARVLPDTVLGDVAMVRGSLGAGLIVAIREARRLAPTHERVELVVISPFATESWDASMDAVRARWDGPVRTMRVAAVTDSMATARMSDDVGISGAAGAPESLRDPVDAALALAIPSAGVASRRTRIVRDAITAADSAAARQGGIVIHWPRLTLPASAFTPRALTLGDRTTIARFAAIAVGGAVPDEGSSRGNAPPIASVIARWGDGAPAALESTLGAGCIRTIGVALSTSGDAALSTSLRAALRELAAPCGGGAMTVVDSARLANWAMHPAREPADSRTARRTLVAEAEQGREAQRWLLAVVALLLAAEWWMRRRRAPDADAEPRSATATSEAA